MRLKGLNRRFIFLLLASSVVISCDEAPNSSLVLEHDEVAIVVPGKGSNCTDKRGGTSPTPTSLSTDFFVMSTFRLVWGGTNELAQGFIRITIDHPYVDGSPITCEISGTLFENTFGVPPYAANTTIDMNDPINGTACAIGCGALKRKAGYENTIFSSVATIEFIGYSQNSDGTEPSPVRANSQVRLNFF